MSKQILAATVAATGLLLLAGVTRSLAAADDDGFPPMTVKCSYTGATCEYEQSHYGTWSECDTTYPHTMIYTRTALAICGKYTPAS